MKKTYFYISIILLFIGIVGQAIAQPTISITPDASSINIGDKIHYLEDVGFKMSLANVRHPYSQAKFKPHYARVPSFGILPNTAIWSKFKYHNQTDEDVYLEIPVAFLDTVRLYIIDGIGKLQKYEAGDTHPFGQRQLLTPTFTFKIPKGQGTCFLYVASPTGITQFPLRFVKISRLFKDHSLKSLINGVYFGIVILIIFYNVFLGIKLKERVYFYYVGFIAATGLTIGQINGYLFQYIHPNYPIINYYENLIYSLNFFIGLFITEFFELRKRMPKAVYGAYFLYFLCFITALLNIIKLPAYANGFIQVSAFISACYMLYVSVNLYSKGYTIARWVLYAWLGYLLGTVLLIGQFAGILPYNFVTANALQLGSSIEIILLSWALAEKINQLKQEKEQAQAEFVNSLQANATLIAEQKTILETKVIERTQELAIKNEELKQNQEEIIAQKDFILQQHHYLKQRDERLTSSIQAAMLIQKAILPAEEALNVLLKEHFLLYLPKDVVSGDFYAVYWVLDKLIVVAADCTGHGVPGAFMTLVGKTLLDKIIEQQEITSPADILQQLHLEINATLHQTDIKADQGMDIAICSIYKTGSLDIEVVFGSAKRPLFYYSQSTKVLQEVRGNRYSIGGFRRKQMVFDNHVLHLQANDTLYLCSDGFIDQNNENRESFGVQKFKTMIAEHAQYPLSMQKQLYYKQLQQHQYGTEQRDDILLLGFKV
jgi:serine phosphatase RsbU (regulator of sigma subunit)